MPGGLVIIPLVIAVILATICPQVFQIGGYVTALNSSMTPAAVAEADPSMAQYVDMATAQCATASIITLTVILLLL